MEIFTKEFLRMYLIRFSLFFIVASFLKGYVFSKESAAGIEFDWHLFIGALIFPIVFHYIQKLLPKKDPNE